jgi:hypothetical protein
MSDQPPDLQERADRSASMWRFVRHIVEMLIAMFVGMAVFGLALGLLLGAVGLGYSHAEHPAVGSVEMAFTMSAGMALWMGFRGHRWRPIVEMSGAMFAPLIAVLPLLWAGALGADGAMVVLHVAMVPLMLGAMLLRRQEYAAPHGRGARRRTALKRTMLYE